MSIEAQRLARDIDVIVIGASAGGVDALTQLLPALPPNLRQTVLVVLTCRATATAR